MRKILLVILTMFCAVTFGQTKIYPLPYQNLGYFGGGVVDNGGLFIIGTFTAPIFTDTTAANLGYCKNYAFSEISTSSDGNRWYRSFDLSHWIKDNSIQTFQQVTTAGDTTNNNLILTDGHGFTDISLSGLNDPSLSVQSPLGQNRFITIASSDIYFSHPISGSGNITMDAPFYSNAVDTIHLPVGLSGTVITHINGIAGDSTGSLTIPISGGTVTSVATGFGLLGGTITTSGTLKTDTTAIPSLFALKDTASILRSLINTSGTVTSLHDSTTNGVAITWINRTTTPAPIVTLGNITPTTITTNSVNLLRQYGATPPPTHGNELIDSAGLGWRDSTGRTVFLNKSLVPVGSTIIDSFQNESGKIVLLKDTQNLIYPYTSNPAGYLTSATANAWLFGGNATPSFYTIGVKNNRGFGILTNNQQAMYIDSLQNLQVLSPNNLGTNQGFTFSQRSFTGGAYPVPYFQPITATSNLNFDLIPHGANGQTIIDVCNSSAADLIANPLAALNTLRLGCSANGGFGSIIQSTTYGAQPAQPLLISVEAANNSTTLRNQLIMDTTGFNAFCPGCSLAGTRPDNYLTVVSSTTAKGIAVVPNGSVSPSYCFNSAFGTQVAYFGYAAGGAGAYLSPTQIGDFGLANAAGQGGNIFIGNRNAKSIWFSTSMVNGADSIRLSINRHGNVTVSIKGDTSYRPDVGLWLKSDAFRGIGLPDFTSGQYASINTPKEDLLTYNTTFHTVMIYDGTAHRTLLDSTKIVAGSGVTVTPSAGGVLTISSTGGGTPSLTSTYVGYGDGSNLLTGSSGLTYASGILNAAQIHSGAGSSYNTGAVAMFTSNGETDGEVSSTSPTQLAGFSWHVGTGITTTYEYGQSYSGNVVGSLPYAKSYEIASNGTLILSAAAASSTIIGDEVGTDVGVQVKNGVAIGLQSTFPISQDASSILQLNSTTQGLLLPRMSTVQKLAIGSPAEGLQVYDLTLHQMSYYNGTVWVNF